METKTNAKKNLIQVVKFGLIGIANTAIDYLLFFVFFSLLNLDKNLAQVLATAIAMTNSYFFNRYWTFGKKGKVKVDEMWKFIIVNLVSMGVTILCLNLFSDVFHLYRFANQLLSAAGIGFQLTGDNAVLFCKVAAIPFSLAVNFLGNRLWVFGKQSKEECGEEKA